MLCLASLTVIALQELRHDLIYGEGVPFGLLSSGLAFVQPSYFWSPAFVFSAKYSLSSIRRCRFYLLLILLGLVAATIGPSTAVLMLPYIQAYPAGETLYYINATADQLWPTSINSSLENPACFLPNATEYATCPSGGYASLKDNFGTWHYGAFRAGTDSRDSPRHRAAAFTDGNWGTSLLTQSPLGLLPATICYGSQATRQRSSQTLALQPSAVVTTQQQQINLDWHQSVLDYPMKKPFSSISTFRYLGLFESRSARLSTCENAHLTRP